MISLRKVTKTYKLGDEIVHALNDISLNIDDKEFIAIIGPSGSGKSTLADIIGGLDKPDTGEILVNDENLAKMHDKALSKYRNKTIGFIFQNFNLQANYTALENVCIPLVLAGMPSKKRMERAKECLKIVGLEDRMKHKPSQLSGGQRQRVAIARAIANNPQVIIADEPTGNLDSQKSDEIITLLKKLNEDGVILIIITHDMEIAKQAKRHISILDGKIV